MNTTPMEPYLALMQRQLATTLRPKGDDNAERIARYSSQVLTQLILQSNTLPALQVVAVKQLDAMLDELNAQLRAIPGGMIITGDLIRHLRITPDFQVAEPALQRAVAVLLANPGDKSSTLLKQISAIISGMQQSLHEAALKQQAEVNKDMDAEQIPALTDAQSQALQGYLRRKFAAETALEIGNIKAIVGGGSKKTLIIDLKNAKQLPSKIVLRADQAGGVVESTVIDEYRLIETVYAAGLPVPQPFVSEIDASIVGAPFIVVSCIEGRNIGDHVDVYEPSESFALSLARALAKLHGIPPEKFGDRVPGVKVSTQEWERQHVASFEAIWRNSGHPCVPLEMAYAWLKNNFQLADGRRALNHGDVGCHNMLAENNVLSALLDWETVFIGNPAYDLAYVQPEIVQCIAWDKFLDEYQRAGGELPSAGEMDFYRLLVAANKIGYLFIALSFFHGGVSDSLILAFGGQHLYQRCEYSLQQVVNEIYSRA